MANKKIKIAVTGSIGSGKSTFCNFISGKGYPLINADEISKKILMEDKDVRQKVIKEFGKESFINNEINKKFLAEKIFSNPENVNRINNILHPKVKRVVDDLIKEYLINNPLVFTEAALIYEADMESMFDYVVLVTSDKNIREKRIIEAGILSREDFLKRDNNQIKDEEKKKRADFVFENNNSIDELEKKANLLINLLNGLSLTANSINKK